jgi:C-terminal peptidase prc
MKDRLRFAAAAIAIFVLASSISGIAQTSSKETGSKELPGAQPGDLKAPSIVPKTQALMDLILVNHVDPPTRQEMILGAARTLYKMAKQVQPLGLSKRISQLASPKEAKAFLEELCREASRREVPADQIEGSLARGILRSVPGEPYLIGAKDLKVNEQLAANRYIGIGIVLRFEDTKKDGAFAQVTEAFRRSPAEKAGIKARDLIVNVDGTDTCDIKLEKVVEMLRGAEGTVVTVSVRQPDATEVRAYKITRSVVPRETVVGFTPTQDGGWKLRADTPAPIAYLSIKEIGSSTVHELRQFEQQFNSEGLEAVILDLRRARGNLHHTVMLADALLDGGRIGQVRTAAGLRTYDAQADCLFRDRTLAVLVDRYTWGETEWLAAALQDQRHAAIVGEPTWAKAFTLSSIPLGDGSGALMLATGLLERGDGRALQGPQVGPPRTPFEINDRKAQESVGGVYPDYFVAKREIEQARPAHEPAPAMNLSEDVHIRKAIEVLQRQLKSSG